MQDSRFWTTDGTGDGDNAGYSQSDMFELFRALCAGRNATNLGGVFPDYQNELAVSGSSSPVSVNTGAGLCYGIPYFNTASETVAVPTPSTATRIDRIVLRADWSAQTVRITRIAGTEGGGAPSLIQSAGTTWDIPLAQASITTGGVITLTDQREWLSLVGDGTVTPEKLAAPLRTTMIPIAFAAGGPAGAGGITTFSTSYVQIYGSALLDASKLPAGCTVKFDAGALWPGGGFNGSVQLRGLGAGAIAGATLTAGGGVFSLQHSGDIAANLPSGPDSYFVWVKTDSDMLGITFYSATLTVEW